MMKCFVFRCRHDLSQNVNWKNNCGSLCAFAVFDLVPQEDVDYVKEWWEAIHIIGHFSPWWIVDTFSPCWILVWSTSLRPHYSTIFTWFSCAFPWRHTVHQFLNKHAVDMFNEFLFSLGDFGKVCLPHPYTTASLIFLVHWQFFQILLVGVALGKAPILIQVLAKQTKFVLVRPIPMSSYLSSQLKYMIFRNIIICILHHLRTYESTMWLAPSWLKSSVGRALHLVSQRSWVSNPVQAWFFLQGWISQLL